MKSRLLLEMQKIADIKALDADVPTPCYLFVQKYGRSIVSELGELAKVLGKEEHFFFKAEGTQKEETVLGRFLLEEERHAGLGRKYNGCVLIELSGEETKKEIYDFLEYLDGQQQRISCIFTSRNYENATYIKQQLEQFFFVRLVEGNKYGAEELLEMFERTLTNYSFKLTEDAKKEMISFLETKKWKESDMVEKRIRNLVNDIVYDKMLEETVSEIEIQKAEIISALEKNEEGTRKKNAIGFVIGG